MDYEVNDNVRKYDDIYYRRMKWKYFKKSPPLLSKLFKNQQSPTIE